MGIRKPYWLALCSAAMLLTAFDGLPHLKDGAATAFSDEGQPLFHASEDYLFTISGNPPHRLIDVSVRTQRALISETGHLRIWINCADFVDGDELCKRRFTASMMTSMIGEVPMPSFDKPEIISPNAARSLPTCPGDPRCP